MKKVFMALAIYSALLTALAIFFSIKRFLFERHHPPGVYILSPEQWSRQVEVYDLEPVKRGNIVFAGDSRIFYAPFADLFPRCSVRGVGGETANLLLQRMPKLLSDSPAAVVVCIGINDIIARRTDIVQNLDSLIRMSSRPLFLMQIMPVAASYPDAERINYWADSINAFIRPHLSGRNHFIQIFSTPLSPNFTWDGIHFNKEGYAQWIRYLNFLQPNIGRI